MHLIMTCNDDTSVSAAKSVTHVRIMRANIVFIFKVRGGNIVTYAQKSLNSMADSNVPVTIVSLIFRQEPVCFARRSRKLPRVSSSLTIPSSLTLWTSS